MESRGCECAFSALCVKNMGGFCGLYLYIKIVKNERKSKIDLFD